MVAASEGVTDPRAALLIIFRGPLSVDPERLLQQLVVAISQQLGIALAEADFNRALRPGQWAAVRENDSRWTGSFRVQLNSHDDAKRMAMHVRSFGIQVGDVLGVFDVHSPYLPDFQSVTPQQGFMVRARAVHTG